MSEFEKRYAETKRAAGDQDTSNSHLEGASMLAGQAQVAAANFSSGVADEEGNLGRYFQGSNGENPGEGGGSGEDPFASDVSQALQAEGSPDDNAFEAAAIVSEAFLPATEQAVDQVGFDSSADYADEVLFGEGETRLDDESKDYVGNEDGLVDLVDDLLDAPSDALVVAGEDTGEATDFRDSDVGVLLSDNVDPTTARLIFTGTDAVFAAAASYGAMASENYQEVRQTVLPSQPENPDGPPEEPEEPEEPVEPGEGPSDDINRETEAAMAEVDAQILAIEQEVEDTDTGELVPEPEGAGPYQTARAETQEGFVARDPEPSTMFFDDSNQGDIGGGNPRSHSNNSTESSYYYNWFNVTNPKSDQTDGSGGVAGAFTNFTNDYGGLFANALLNTANNGGNDTFGSTFLPTSDEILLAMGSNAAVLTSINSITKVTGSPSGYRESTFNPSDSPLRSDDLMLVDNVNLNPMLNEAIYRENGSLSTLDQTYFGNSSISSQVGGVEALVFTAE